MDNITHLDILDDDDNDNTENDDDSDEVTEDNNEIDNVDELNDKKIKAVQDIDIPQLNTDESTSKFNNEIKKVTIIILQITDIILELEKKAHTRMRIIRNFNTHSMKRAI